MSERVSSSSETLTFQQHAFLLHQLANAPEGILSQSDANKTIPKQIKEELKLGSEAANKARGGMASSGWLIEEKINRKVIYSITDAGKQQYRVLERYIPLLPAKEKAKKGKANQPADERMRVAREAYILSALHQAPSHTISKADLETGFGGKGKPKVAELATKHPHLAYFRDQYCLGLNPATTRTVLSEFALSGNILVHRTADSESYSLAPAGKELFSRLRSEFPVLPPTGKPTPTSSETVRRAHEAYLLLKLLQSVEYTLRESDATVGSYPKSFKLNHATAWQVRGELAQQGYIAIHWNGKEGSYTLTPSGKRHLTTLPFDAFGEFKIKGSVLTELLTAAREGGKSTTETPASTSAEPRTHHTMLTAEQLESAVMDIFHELLRGRFANLRMVPIHEIRHEITNRLGTHAVSHADFNELLLDLRRTDKVRLISISDRSRATSEQLRDSVFAVGETFFYMEKAHDAQGG